MRLISFDVHTYYNTPATSTVSIYIFLLPWTVVISSYHFLEAYGILWLKKETYIHQARKFGGSSKHTTSKERERTTWSLKVFQNIGTPCFHNRVMSHFRTLEGPVTTMAGKEPKNGLAVRVLRPALRALTHWERPFARFVWVQHRKWSSCFSSYPGRINLGRHCGTCPRPDGCPKTKGAGNMNQLKVAPCEDRKHLCKKC